MKNIFLAAAISIGLLLNSTPNIQAQVNVNINIAQQPAWGPVGHNYVQYYYIPEYNIYYDVMMNRYVYMHNSRWIHNAMLPRHLRHINLYNTHKVVVNQHNAFHYNQRHRRDYGHFRHSRNQMVWRDHRGHRPHSFAQQQRHRVEHGRNNYHRPPTQHAQRNPRIGQHERRGNSTLQQGRGQGNRQYNSNRNAHNNRPMGGNRGTHNR